MSRSNILAIFYINLGCALPKMKNNNNSSRGHKNPLSTSDLFYSKTKFLIKDVPMHQDVEDERVIFATPFFIKE